MTDPSESILRRVRALLERAEHAGTGEAEAEAAMAKATQIMADYGIARAMLGASAPDDPIDQTSIAMTDPYSYEKAMLLNGVARAFRCKPMRHYRGRKTIRVAVVGAASDREQVNMLYTSLLIQAERGMRREVPGGYYAQDTRNDRAAWLAGFAGRISERLSATQRRAQADYDTAHAGEPGTPGTALVLADRAALIERRFAELFPSTTKGRGRRYNTSTYRQGERAGQAADIGTTRVRAGATRHLGGGA